MARQQPRDIEEWRLGIELGEHAEAPVESPPRSPDEQPFERLERAVYVVTVERAAWLVLAVLALATRLVALDLRPLGPDEAREALLELELAARGLESAAQHAAPLLSWVPLGGSLVFSVFGASDFTARLIAALGGLLLAGSAFTLRPYVGRAGAIAFAALLVISPTFTYLSRSGDWHIVMLGLVMIAFVLTFRTMRRPTPMRAATPGCVAGLALAADPAALSIVAIVAAILAMIGIWDAVARGNGVLRLKVWWERRRSTVVLFAVTAVAVWLTLSTAFFSDSIFLVLVESARSNLQGLADPGYGAAVRFYAPMLGFYEFLIALLAVAGLVAMIARRGWSRFSFACVAWMLLALAVYPLVAARHPSSVVLILLPMALVAALGVDHLERTRAWPSVRVAIAVLGAVGLYVQVMTNFVYAAPDAGAAPWARHALLFWRVPATTDRARTECVQALRAMRDTDASAFVPDGMPAMRWYLRSLARADKPDDANISVAPPGATSAAQATVLEERYEFGLEESWTPDLGSLDLAAALKFFFTARAWSEVKLREVAISIRTRTAAGAPTIILTPPPQP